MARTLDKPLFHHQVHPSILPSACTLGDLIPFFKQDSCSTFAPQCRKQEHASHRRLPPLALAFAAPAAQADTAGRPDSDIAALQVALRAESLYSGSVDGILGAATADALVEFQARSGLTPDGVAGPKTRRALGRLGAPDLGIRRLIRGAVGWDVAELQFLLAWHGFPSGTFDGVFGSRLEAAVRRFQRFEGLPQIGEAGPQTRRAVRSGRFPVSPIRLTDPVHAPIGDGFGPRGNAFHAGVDFIAPLGTPVGAAGSGSRHLGRPAR